MSPMSLMSDKEEEEESEEPSSTEESSAAAEEAVEEPEAVPSSSLPLPRCTAGEGEATGAARTGPLKKIRS